MSGDADYKGYRGEALAALKNFGAMVWSDVEIKTARGIASSNSGVLYLVLGIVGLSIVSWALMQNELNNLAG